MITEHNIGEARGANWGALALGVGIGVVAMIALKRRARRKEPVPSRVVRKIQERYAPEGLTGAQRLFMGVAGGALAYFGYRKDNAAAQVARTAGMTMMRNAILNPTQSEAPVPVGSLLTSTSGGR